MSMKLILLINIKMPTIVGIVTFISTINITSKSFKAMKIFIQKKKHSAYSRTIFSTVLDPRLHKTLFMSMKLILLINIKMPTIVGILTFISTINITSKSFKAMKIFIQKKKTFSILKNHFLYCTESEVT